jgi:hypothetical protein
MKKLLTITAAAIFLVGCASAEILVTIMPAPTGDGHVRSYSPFGLQNIAEQYLSDHHITIKKDNVAVTVQMDTNQPFATVYFLKSSTPIHAVEIRADGTVIREYSCQTIKVK